MPPISAVFVGLALAVGPQATDARVEAERLARTGSHAEALRRFQALAAANPDDVAARLWVGRLHEWMGHEHRALDIYRSVLASHPQNVDALVGAGRSLTRLGRFAEASDALNRAESIAADNLSLLAAQGHLHRHAGRSTLALAYYERALALQPADAESRAGAQALRAERAHRIAATYNWERFDVDVPDTHAGIVEINARVNDAFRAFVAGHHQRKFSRDETRGGAGFEWRNGRSLGLRAGGLVGTGTSVLPEVDASVDATYSRRRVAWLGGFRYLRFDSSTTWIVSPGVTLSPLVDSHITLRYYVSQTDFSRSPAAETNQGFSARAAGKLTPRLWLNTGYLHGFEGLSIITSERLVQLDADTISLGFRFDPVPMTSLLTTYEHQWRDNDSRVSAVFVTLVQRF